MSAQTTAPEHAASACIPFEFCWTRKFTERANVTGFREVLVPPPMTILNPMGSGWTQIVRLVTVQTSQGPLAIKVSCKLADLIRLNDMLVVRYQRSRWRKALKGKIAR